MGSPVNTDHAAVGRSRHRLGQVPDSLLGKRVMGALPMMVFILCALLTSCRIHLVAPFDEGLLRQTEEVAREVDRLYLTMIRAGDGGAIFDEHKAAYIDMEVRLRSILDQNRVRTKNEETTGIARSCLDQWLIFTERHAEAKVLLAADARMDRAVMMDLLHALYVAEKAKSLLKEH